MVKILIKFSILNQLSIKKHKQNMADILNNLSKYFKIKNFKLFTTKINEKIFKTFILVGKLL